MAIKVGDTFYSGVAYLPGRAPEYLPPLTDVRDDRLYETMWCKHCYRGGVQPVSSYSEWPAFKGEGRIARRYSKHIGRLVEDIEEVVQEFAV